MPGEPECFNVTIDETLGLKNVLPEITDLRGLRGGIIPSSAVDVKWVSHWKGYKFNQPALGGQDLVEIDTGTLQAIDVPGGNSNKAWFCSPSPRPLPRILTTAQFTFIISRVSMPFR